MGILVAEKRKYFERWKITLNINLQHFVNKELGNQSLGHVSII
jgi:hypothetical protein